MNLQDLYLKKLGINKEELGRIYTFVDFGNVNYWYEKDTHDLDNKPLKSGTKLVVDLENLSKFLSFSDAKRFYYGLDKHNKRSWHIIAKARKFFTTQTKSIQWVRHYLNEIEQKLNSRPIRQDTGGYYIQIPKCNFDVEICIDAIRLIDEYDTFCLLSSDNDFARLATFLKRKNKKIILIAAGYVSHWLKDSADLYINAQKVKNSIAIIKETSPQ